ncbi:H-NS family nucleoid-associated regulatory protein [Bradyrhizobium sp. RT5a]|uniref:H-NS family nucleoid-associated regulatory protein n=1 Tax=Bradyrhizobium sp. RT5a TaxID=3156380 RepID=UPI003393597F
MTRLLRARKSELLAESERVGALVTSKPSTARPKRPVKYRDGENTWTGVGTMPTWAKLKGDSLEQYRV